MKTTNAFWIILALTTSVLVAPSAHSQTERLSASLSGANEVPPINSAGTGNFEMTIQPGMITFSYSTSTSCTPLQITVFTSVLPRI
jgi:hypothetical protein